MSNKYFGLITAAGKGSRFLNDDINSTNPTTNIPKQYFKIAGKPIIYHSVLAFSQVAKIEEIHIVLSDGDECWEKEMPELIKSINKKIFIHFVGGETRGMSVVNGCFKINSSQDNDWVLVHDAARPCINPADINNLISKVSENYEQNPVGGILAAPVADTIKLAHNNLIEKTINRQNLWQAQTPQMFRLKDLQLAYKNFPDATDEALAIEKYLEQYKLAQNILLVAGCPNNIKITYRNDINIAKTILSNRLLTL